VLVAETWERAVNLHPDQGDGHGTGKPPVSTPTRTRKPTPNACIKEGGAGIRFDAVDRVDAVGLEISAGRARHRASPRRHPSVEPTSSLLRTAGTTPVEDVGDGTGRAARGRETPP